MVLNFSSVSYETPECKDQTPQTRMGENTLIDVIFITMSNLCSRIEYPPGSVFALVPRSPASCAYSRQIAVSFENLLQGQRGCAIRNWNIYC